jgi:hypothetical protein
VRLEHLVEADLQPLTEVLDLCREVLAATPTIIAPGRGSYTR